MTRAEAKRVACLLSAGAIQGLLASGWPFEDAALEHVYSESDEDRLSKALNELSAELYRRAGDTRDPRCKT